MIDVTEKQVSLRTATTRGEIRMELATVERIENNDLPKGNLFDIAKAAAFLGAKSTPNLIPHCHPVPVENLEIKFELNRELPGVVAEVYAKTVYKTGIEMEALTALSVALLTIYDLLKPVDKTLEIAAIKLVKKTGGRSEALADQKKGHTAAVLVCSDSTAAGKREDKSGKLIKEILEKFEVNVVDYQIIPDEPAEITRWVTEWVQKDIHFVFTTGGTGLSPRDRTADTVKQLLEKEAPGIAEAMRSYGMNMTPKAMHSRSISGSIGKTLITCLPGSSGGVRESLAAVLPGLFHARSMLSGGGH